MARYVAFLRAINVGGHVVKMDVLRGVFESLGFAPVETFIASGNVVFEAASRDEAGLRSTIESALEAGLGHDAATFLRSEADVAEAAAHEAFAAADVERSLSFNIAFLHEPLDDDAVDRLMGLRGKIDDFRVHGRDVYWLCTTRQSQSTFSNAVLEKTVGVPSTLRGVNTVRRMVAKYGFRVGG